MKAALRQLHVCFSAGMGYVVAFTVDLFCNSDAGFLSTFIVLFLSIK